MPHARIDPDSPRLHLRRVTRRAHETLESRFDAVAALSDPEGQKEALPRYHRMYAAFNQALLPWLEEFSPHPRRDAALLRDLRSAGVAPPGDIPAIVAAGEAEAWGLFYVAEGSALGGRMILQALVRHGAPTAWLSFLDMPETGERWKRLLAGLDARLTTPTALEEASMGAMRGFHHAEQCLCPEPSR